VNISEIKPEYKANKISSKHEVETGERNVVLTPRNLLSLCQQIVSTFSGIKRNGIVQLSKNSLIRGCLGATPLT